MRSESRHAQEDNSTNLELVNHIQQGTEEELRVIPELLNDSSSLDGELSDQHQHLLDLVGLSGPGKIQCRTPILNTMMEQM